MLPEGRRVFLAVINAVDTYHALWLIPRSKDVQYVQYMSRGYITDTGAYVQLAASTAYYVTYWYIPD